jgi:nickel transport protein
MKNLAFLIPDEPMLPRGAVAAAMLLLAPGVAPAHGMLHEAGSAEAIIVRFAYPGADPPVFEAYEVHAPGDEAPFQAGRTNALGELSFRPDRPGRWRVRVYTEDGHGTVVDLEVDEAGGLDPLVGGHAHEHDLGQRVFAGLGYLLGAFGLLALWRARRARPGPA